MADKKADGSIKGYLDKLLGDDGVKTDINFSMEADTMLYLGIVLVSSGIVITLFAYGMGMLFKGTVPVEIVKQ